MTWRWNKAYFRSIRVVTMSTVFVLLLGLSAYAADGVELDQYGGWTGLQGKKTGFFHLEEIGGRNWFVTPDGNVFFPVALSHLYSGESDVACENVYGGDKEAWMKGAFAMARAMGFNCALGSATSPERNLNGFVEIPKVEA